MRIVLVVLVALAASPASAENGPWRPAPTPHVGTTEHVMPAARAGHSTGSAQDAPFSALPTDSVTAGGATSSNVVNGAQTPNLSPK